jgi:hypothetical protein
MSRDPEGVTQQGKMMPAAIISFTDVSRTDLLLEKKLQSFP